MAGKREIVLRKGDRRNECWVGDVQVEVARFGKIMRLQNVLDKLSLGRMVN